MKITSEVKESIERFISSGMVGHISNNVNLTQNTVIEIEDILNRHNDSTARTKIRKIFKNL